MKFSDIKALAAHLQSPQLASLYLVLSKDSYALQEALRLIVDAVSCGDKSRVRVCEGNRVLSELDAFSLFAEEAVILVRDVDEMAKESLKQLEKRLSALPRSVRLVLGATALNRSTLFYKECEKSGVVLDLPEEKPWEKEASVKTWLQEMAKEKKLGIDRQLVELMVRQIGTDKGLLAMELEKLSLYKGKEPLTADDVRTVCSVVHTDTLWQLGDAIFRRDGKVAMEIGVGLIEEGASIMSLSRGLRSQIETKLHIAQLLADGGGTAAVSQRFPYMRGRILDDNCRAATSYGLPKLRQALLFVDGIEERMKSQTVNDRVLTERLIAELTQ